MDKDYIKALGKKVVKYYQSLTKTEPTHWRAHMDITERFSVLTEAGGSEKEIKALLDEIELLDGRGSAAEEIKLALEELSRTAKL